MFLSPDDLIKILLAVLLGGLIGAEREMRDKSAGFRTMILICVGAALLTILSTRLAGDNDPTRIAANIVTGIGFLGAGAILRDGNRITGLTTASTIWLSAAVGMAAGGGQYALAAVVALAALVVLWVFPSFEGWIDDLRHSRTYQVVCQLDMDIYARLEAIFSQHGLKLGHRKRTKSGGLMTCTWQAIGTPKAHDRLVEALFLSEDVKELHY